MLEMEGGVDAVKSVSNGSVKVDSNDGSQQRTKPDR